MHTVRLLICPRDGAPLMWNASVSVAHCTRCDATLTKEHGVFSVGDAPNEFYEGRYDAHVKYLPRSERPLHVLPLWLLNSGYIWIVRRVLQAGATVAEMGCGGGIAYFGRRYEMIGLDLSLRSLAKAAEVYSIALQCDVTERVPLGSNSLDGLVSASFFEHVLPAAKRTLVEECYRVLKPGGRLVFLYDIETRNPLISAMRNADPGKYQKLFLDNDGHVGYESFARNIEYFRDAGFEVEKSIGIEKTPFLATSALSKFAEWETRYGKGFQLVRFLNFRPWSLAYAVYLRALDVFFGRFLPNDWARVAVAVCRKV